MKQRKRPATTIHNSKTEQHELDYESLSKLDMQDLLKHKKIRTQKGVVVNTKAIRYFRGQDFVRWVLKHQAYLIQQYSHLLPSFKNDEILTEDDAKSLANELLNRHLIYKAHYVPYFGVSESNLAEHKTVKWPKKLEYSENQTFDDSSFYVLLYEVPDNWKYLYLGLIIMFVLVICMFPAWPLKMKLMLWYATVALSSLLFATIVIRLVVFLILWFAGFDFWIFPNFFADDLGVIDSLIPIYSSYYRKDGVLMMFCRVVLAIMASVTIWQLRKTHNVSDIHDFARRQFLDIVDWGVQKLSAGPASEYEALPETDPYDCFKKCGFETFQELKSECLEDCQCIEALMDSHCYPKCIDSIKKLIAATKLEVCSMTNSKTT